MCYLLYLSLLSAKKSLDAGLPCTQSDCGISRAVLKDRQVHGAMQCVISALRYVGTLSELGFVDKHQCFISGESSYRKSVEGA